MYEGIEMQKVDFCGVAATYFIPNDEHVFAVTDDKKYTWPFFGRGYPTEGSRIILTANLPIEWAFSLIKAHQVNGMPVNDGAGIINQMSGTCHTAANRLLILSEAEADVTEAKGDDYSVILFGKYGFGIVDFAKRLADTYPVSYNGKKNDDLQIVLSRLLNFLPTEFNAWRRVLESNFTFDTYDLIKNYPVGYPYIVEKITSYYQYRENLFSKYNYDESRKKEFLIELSNGALEKYILIVLNDMHSMGVISSAKKDSIYSTMEGFIKNLIKQL